MRIFKSKWFSKFVRKEDIGDEKLYEAIQNAEAGKIDVDYGNNVIKQRIARPHKGKSSGYRLIILYHRNDKAFFVYGFSKNERDNINETETKEFKRLAKITLSFSDDILETLLKKGVYTEVKHDD